MLATYGGVVFGTADGHGDPDKEERIIDSNKPGQNTAPPSGAEEEDYFPLAMRLPTARARQLELRHYVNRFRALNTFQAVRIR
jgi:hypothetical protein